MKSISLDVLRGPAQIVCLLILTATSVSSLTNSITSFAAAKPKAPVKIAQATVVKPNNQKENILTTAKGFALYFYDDDKNIKKPDCNIITNKACTAIWPPLLFKGTLPAVAGLSGLVLTKNTNSSQAKGSQVTYQGHLLYTYKDDKKPLVATGNLDDKGKWHIATPDLASVS